MVELQVEANFPLVSEICKTESGTQNNSKKVDRRFRELPIRR